MHSEPPDHAVQRPEARHVRPPQEGAGLPAAALCRELHPGDLRHRGGPRRGDPGGGRRRALLQRGGRPDRPQDGGRQRVRPGSGRPARPPVDARRVVRDPQARGDRRRRPVGEPQPGRPGRGFRHQVQRRPWRPGAGELHGRGLPAHRRDPRVPHRRSARTRSRPPRRDPARRDPDRGDRPGRRLPGADGAADRLRAHRGPVPLGLPDALRRAERHHGPLRDGDPGGPPRRARRHRDERRAEARFRRPPPGPEPGPRPRAHGA